MPPNTPTIYIVGALIALGGVLFGALGQITSSTLQRRHERRLKLDEVRRETYAAMLTAIRETPRREADARAALTEAEEHKAKIDLTSETTVEKWRGDRLVEARERLRTLREERSALVAKVSIVGGLEVQREAAAVLKNVLETGKLHPRGEDAFVNACRKELGVKGQFDPGEK